MNGLERHLTSESGLETRVRRPTPVSDYVVELLLAECDALEGEMSEQIREGDLGLDRARELLANALRQLGHEPVSYRLRRLERLAWEIHIDPLRFGGPNVPRNWVGARREIPMRRSPCAAIGPCGDRDSALVGSCAIATDDTRVMLPVTAESCVSNPEARRRLPVGAILAGSAEESSWVVGRTRILPDAGEPIADRGRSALVDVQETVAT